MARTPMGAATRRNRAVRSLALGYPIGLLTTIADSTPTGGLERVSNWLFGAFVASFILYGDLP